MSLSTEQDVLNEIPHEVLLAVNRQAEEDADNVACFLSCLAVQLLPAGNLPSTASFESELLLGLGAALRIAIWEEAGVLRAFPQLPHPKTALRESLFAERPNGSRSRSEEVLESTIRQLAWNSGEMGIVAVSHDVDDEDFGRRLAIFFWNHRHLIGVENEKAPTA